jgi:hypothetical protein
MSVHLRIDGAADRPQPWLVDDPEADLPGQISDDWVPALGGRDHAVQGAAPNIVDEVALRTLLQPTLEDADDNRDLVAHALL